MANSFILGLALLGSVYCQHGTDSIQIVSECREKVMDIFFLLDSSNSIWIVYYRQMLQFVRGVVKRLDIGDDFTRVGGLSFSDGYTRPPLLLNRSNSQSEVLDSINLTNMPYRTGLRTNTHLALRYVRENIEFRSGVTKVMVVVTDGGSTEQNSTTREAQLAHDEDFNVFVVGVGHYREESGMRAIASKPNDSFIFNTPELSNVTSILPGRVCSLATVFVGSCNIKQQVNLTFVAGPANNDRAYDIIEIFVNSIRDPHRYVSYSLFLDICQNPPGDIQPNEFGRYCIRSNNQGMANESSLTSLVQQLDNATATNSDVRQVVVVFMDPYTLYFARMAVSNVVVFMDPYTLYFARNQTFNDLVDLKKERGFELLFMGMGLEDRDIICAWLHIQDTFNVDAGPLKNQGSVLRDFANRICYGINSATPSLGLDAD
ncbi:hypothetical protein RRG08_048688 [Elysia crispata]|uniref:VWFA domain-containing protein n=1 Tax=Elysia crispata TaxID=231223 RepID=A0AAE1A6I8_9GAST|nr:hypothetical protein RRG08_048688 [Elysia crispata]KAK3782229.1 hypothetical protein RRG08_048688 [Elysia crispata]KAK3782230.1 hypothetical protein RRG08_048688 [Elysia crispata]